MDGYEYALQLVGAVLITNAIPHFVNGVSGRPSSRRSGSRPAWVSPPPSRT